MVIKCLECGTILFSKHQHDFQRCPCNNETFVDGGFDYCRVGGKDIGKIKNFYNCLTCKFSRLTDDLKDSAYFLCTRHPECENAGEMFNDYNIIIWDKLNNEVYSQIGKYIENCKVWRKKEE